MSEICDVCGLEYWDEGAGNAVRCESLRGWRGSDPEEAQCLRRGYERLQREVAAAEERGRRAGIEAHIRDLHAIENALDEFETDPPTALRVVGEHVGMALHNLRALAPRDSGKAGT